MQVRYENIVGITRKIFPLCCAKLKSIYQVNLKIYMIVHRSKWDAQTMHLQLRTVSKNDRTIQQNITFDLNPMNK